MQFLHLLQSRWCHHPESLKVEQEAPKHSVKPAVRHTPCASPAIFPVPFAPGSMPWVAVALAPQLFRSQLCLSGLAQLNHL